jgi:hypothetical protein
MAVGIYIQKLVLPFSNPIDKMNSNAELNISAAISGMVLTLAARPGHFQPHEVEEMVYMLKASLAAFERGAEYPEVLFFLSEREQTVYDQLLHATNVVDDVRNLPKESSAASSQVMAQPVEIVNNPPKNETENLPKQPTASATSVDRPSEAKKAPSRLRQPTKTAQEPQERASVAKKGTTGAAKMSTTRSPTSPSKQEAKVVPIQKKTVATTRLPTHAASVAPSDRPGIDKVPGKAKKSVRSSPEEEKKKEVASARAKALAYAAAFSHRQKAKMGGRS